MDLIKRSTAKLTARFKATRFAKWFRRTFIEDELSSADCAALILLLVVLVVAAPAIAANKATKKKRK